MPLLISLPEKPHINGSVIDLERDESSEVIFVLAAVRKTVVLRKQSNLLSLLLFVLTGRISFL
jgi:hypothetical protein